MKFLLTITIILDTLYAKLISDLEIFHINEEDSLYKFTFTIEQNLDLESQISEQNFISRSFLENLHAIAGVKELYLSFTQGRINQVKINDFESFPSHGVTLLTNDNIHQEITISQISELFRTAKFNMMQLNNHLIFKQYELTYKPFGFSEGLQFSSQKIFYAQDTVDYLCVDTIENLKRILKCADKGLMGLIDQNRLFQASYTSLQAYFKYDQNKKKANQKFVLLTIIPKNLFSEVFKLDRIEYCPYHEEAFVKHHGRKTQYNLNLAKYMPLQTIRRQNDDTILQRSITRLIDQKNYITGEWFAFSSKYSHWVEARVDGTIVLTLYFTNAYVPIFSSMIIQLRDISGEYIQENIQKNLIFGDGYKKIEISGQLKQNQQLLVSINFDKKMRTFEDYPHDPERGDDFISLPVQFSSDEKNITELYFTENQVTHIPAPDFSMPFNILTYTCITLGYYFLHILKFAVDKQELNIKEKGSILQRILRFIVEKFSMK